ncbi:hypothetical protein H4219_000885 [Mycoemilia scoparia]|uniref:Uncharacterized protein n=1 Tax=Mycoemilia scoparia TaxID=417184 RepID=A0A9W8DR05_9FUNG|nr:hypothetical protein H4219_000885 [Mycoemilia scoparia]
MVEVMRPPPPVVEELVAAVLVGVVDPEVDELLMVTGVDGVVELAEVAVDDGVVVGGLDPELDPEETEDDLDELDTEDTLELEDCVTPVVGLGPGGWAL